MKPKQPASLKRCLLILIAMACVTLVAISAVKLFSATSEYSEAQNAYDDLAQYIIMLSPTPSPYLPQPEFEGSDATGSENTQGGITPANRSPYPQIDFDALKAINPDIVGWLYCAGTPINYPLVQGSDNDYYLHHLYNRKPNKSGCLFIDFANVPDFTDHNTVIYGHNMKSGAMFAVLEKYKNGNPCIHARHPKPLPLSWLHIRFGDATLLLRLPVL